MATSNVEGMIANFLTRKDQKYPELDLLGSRDMRTIRHATCLQ